MNLSTKAKNRRDVVEDPLFRLGRLIDMLTQIRTRVDAAMKVWPEISKTLQPALRLLDEILNDMTNLRSGLSQVWREGFEINWKK